MKHLEDFMEVIRDLERSGLIADRASDCSDGHHKNASSNA